MHILLYAIKKKKKKYYCETNTFLVILKYFSLLKFGCFIVHLFMR